MNNTEESIEMISDDDIVSGKKKAKASPKKVTAKAKPKAKPKSNGASSQNGKNKKYALTDSEEEEDMIFGNGGDVGNNKRLSVERIYQKKSQLEHILLRPDTYIGSVEFLTQQMWVFDEDIGMNTREVTFVPGLYKIFDEILVNAADNKQRDPKMDTIKIEVDG